MKFLKLHLLSAFLLILLVLTSSRAQSGPDLLQYKFENNPSADSVINCAFPGVGTHTAPLQYATPLTPGGQFDTCISGNGGGYSGVITGWNCDLGTSSWTISMWVTITSQGIPIAFHFFGDVGSGSFRCYHDGDAGLNNLVLKGNFTAITVTGIAPAPTVVTFVYDSAAGQVRAYKNGVLATTVNQTLNIPTGTGFKVGGYTAALPEPSFRGKMDEFRMYRRALTPAEVLALWNQDLDCANGPVAINTQNGQIPNSYMLDQNYPNPFNPLTSIKFALPKADFVTIKVYDALGREVQTLVNEQKNAGSYSIDFDGSKISSGIYIYKIETPEFSDVKKMVLIK